MTFLALAAFLASGETVVLQEDARVGGRFVRLAELIDPDHTAESVRAKLGEIYLGRSPEEGQTRIVNVDEIRRELDRRGLDPDAFVFVGKKVEVRRGQEPATTGLRRAIAQEVKKILLEKNLNDRADAMIVTISKLSPEELPSPCRISEIRVRGVLEYDVVLVDAEKNRIEVQAVARVVRLRDAVFAAREVAAGRILERADLEVRRIEISDGDSSLEDPAAFVGASAAVRIPKGTKIGPLVLKAKAGVRKGDLVRAVSSAYEVDARSLDDGAPGQEIRLEFVGSGNRVRGRVAAGGRVEVAEEGR